VRGSAVDPFTIDKPFALPYITFMVRFHRLCVTLLLAAFIAGSLVHAVSATPMAVKMALGGGAMDMADCDSCGSGDADSEPVCETACITPLAAVACGRDEVFVDKRGPSTVYLAGEIDGRSGPPDPHPPRSLV